MYWPIVKFVTLASIEPADTSSTPLPKLSPPDL